MNSQRQPSRPVPPFWHRVPLWTKKTKSKPGCLIWESIAALSEVCVPFKWGFSGSYFQAENAEGTDGSTDPIPGWIGELINQWESRRKRMMCTGANQGNNSQRPGRKMSHWSDILRMAQQGRQGHMLGNAFLKRSSPEMSCFWILASASSSISVQKKRTLWKHIIKFQKKSGCAFSCPIWSLLKGTEMLTLIWGNWR